ncbi:aquaporin AQPAn.G isoform X1 [Halyomorpha halys]|uniref:aquaporin AQPAn.G isoform X1 n=1 Tax=Halyomorpha halys TaxID=286706 RepID=UPI0006D4D828|nr:aquaporin AQPAn.G-like isoform X1 [Halyomorpha halys]
MSFVNNINFDFKCSLFKEKNEKEKDELIYKFVQVFVGEFLGTGMLVFWGCACSGEVNEGGQTIKALMFGIIFGLCIQIFGLDTTCHINPAITLTFVIFGDVSLVLGLFYVLCQILGGLVGYAVLELIGPEEMSFYGLVKIKNFCVTSVIAEVGIAKTLFWEASGTGTLCLMICSILDTKNRDRIETIPIKLTLCVFTMVYICLPYTGGSINPARSIGPALWHMVFADHWVYWIGPLIGSLFVTVLYHLIFLPKDEDQRISLSTVGLKSPLPTGKKV